MMSLRGVSYLIDDIEPADQREHLRIIAADLHCDTVMLIGRDATQLVDAARRALELGLDVYLRPDPTDRSQRQMLRHLGLVAEAADTLRRGHPGRVTLLVGSEFSHTVPGIVPGPRSFLRLQLIIRFHRVLRRRIDRRLHKLLARAVAVARAGFGGPITYSAAGWESVDWSPFDLVGVASYRSARNQDSYRDRIRALVRDHDKPVIVTEFGCGAFAGADRRGAGSFQIVDWFATPPRIRGDHPRDEAVQARYLAELIDLFDEEGVGGCFVFTFAMPGFPYAEEPANDLDKAGFGLLAVEPDGSSLRRKQAFGVVAVRYSR
ncbi:hypothetical protein [Nocardia sp. NPDC051832]|uniref:hypothetical protein n=1 Tax=Nocardia sp. NPDC051832 TaxID=3155673 RepID=UPI00343FC6F2